MSDRAWFDEQVAKLTRVVACARKLVVCGDEFLPEYPGALEEHFNALVEAIDAVADPEEGAALAIAREHEIAALRAQLAAALPGDSGHGDAGETARLREAAKRAEKLLDRAYPAVASRVLQLEEAGETVAHAAWGRVARDVFEAHGILRAALAGTAPEAEGE